MAALPPFPDTYPAPQTLLSKIFVEGGFKDFEGFKALEMAFDQEHRGDRAHAHFMRSLCQHISAPIPDPTLPRRDTDRSTPAIVEETPSEDASAHSEDAPSASPKPPGSPRPGDKTPKGESKKKKKKGAQIAERHPKPHKRGNGPPGNPPAPKSAKSWPKFSPASTFEAPKLSPSNGKILLFVSCPVFWAS